MSETDTAGARRPVGVAGVAAGALSLSTVPLYFVYSGAPPAWNVLTRNLLTILTVMALLPFLTGLRCLITRAGPGHDWAAALVQASGAVYATLILVGVSLEAGVVFGHPGTPVDPTTTGPLADAAILIHGSIGRGVTAVLLLAAGTAIRRTRILPPWLSASALLIALVNLACLPSLYFGTAAATFYSALGWGVTALVASLIGYWILAAGIVLLRRPHH
jgi:hypothetical protein